MKQLVVIAHNLRSAHNVGSLLRTADGLGVETVYLTGYTPYPPQPGDLRLPHEQVKIAKQIEKTALGASQSQPWRHCQLDEAITELRAQGYVIAGLEQNADSQPLPQYTSPEKLALVLGRERDGLEPEALAQCDLALEIPMLGAKESYNVVQAAAMALYHCRFIA